MTLVPYKRIGEPDDVARAAAWLVSDAAPALLLGLAVISVVAASIGYLLSAFVWRNLVARKRRQRLADSRLAALADEGADLIPAE